MCTKTFLRNAPIWAGLVLSVTMAPRVAVADGTWSPAADMGAWHSVHTSVLLQDGRVAVIGTSDYGPSDPRAGEGGYIEVYDPANDAWQLPLPHPCDGLETCHNALSNFAGTATLLDDGTVLIAGGTADGDTGTSRAWIFDPDQGSLTETGFLAGFFGGPRFHHTATKLQNGRVFIAGGQGVDAGPGEGSDFTAEIYDPATGEWTLVAPMSASRTRPESVRLDDGRVLVVGGGSAEIYDPSIDAWTDAGTLGSDAGDVNFGLVKTDAGEIFVVGGSVGTGGTTAVEQFDPASSSWQPVASMNHPRSFHVTVALTDGKVLAAGGHPVESNGTAEVYDPETNQWSTTPPLNVRRDWSAATRMPDGRVLVSGTLVPQDLGHTAEIFSQSCTVTEDPEQSCSDGVDNDCDGLVDGGDSDCSIDPCVPKGGACSVDGDCCSNKCRGPSGQQACKGGA